MRGRAAVLLSILLLAVFSAAVLLRRLPSGTAQAVRAEEVDAGLLLTGGDGETRAALELLPGEKLDLNAASAEELQRLPGVGVKLSEAIVAYRAEHGPFRQAEDVMKVPGIGPARYAALADSITVDPEAQKKEAP